jgi:hypothetical protein
MRGALESRLARLEGRRDGNTWTGPIGRLIADPRQHAWATSKAGINAEVARRQASGELPEHVIVRVIVKPPACN